MGSDELGIEDDDSRCSGSLSNVAVVVTVVS